jgi:hypothetical protein
LQNYNIRSPNNHMVIMHSLSGGGKGRIGIIGYDALDYTLISRGSAGPRSASSVFCLIKKHGFCSSSTLMTIKAWDYL